MIYYDRIDVSEGVDFNKTSGSKDFFFFYLFGFSFMNIHGSQDCRGRGRVFC